MKSLLKITSFFVLILVLAYFILKVWTGDSVRDNIAYAQGKYHGKADEGLIAMLLDEKIPTNDKTHIAVWTLGQLQAEKALPLLKKLYLDDPDGETCYGKHDQVICQYEIYKAIEAIEGNMLFSFAYLNQ